MTLNPFSQQTPDSVEAALEGASASCISFNRGPYAGHYLAVGRSDGFVVLYDVETRGPACVCEGHVKAVTDVCWSANGRFIASSSLDWNVIVWDLKPNAVQSTSRAATLRFDAAAASVEFSPKTSQLLLVVLESQQAICVDISLRRRRRTDAASSSSSPLHDDDVQRIEQRWDLSREVDASDGSLTAARFHPSGTHILAGTSRGCLLLFSLNPRALVSRVPLGGSSSVRQLAFDRAGRNVVVNSNDRVIRVVSVEARPNASFALSSQPAHRFQDLINRTPWNGIGFSGDAEYVFAGAAHMAAHNIYIWDRGAGALDKILEGPREPLIDVDWHPARPLLASVSAGGTVNLWFTPTAEIWSAYAPGFEELEENVEYEEREDEFDVEDEDEASRRKRDEEEALVDILSPSLATGGGETEPRAHALPGAALQGSKVAVVEVGLWAEEGADAEDEAWEYFRSKDADDDAYFVVPVDLSSSGNLSSLEGSP